MKKILLTILVATLSLPNAGWAATFFGADNVSVDEAQIDDIYAAGGMVQVNQPVEGDLLITGGQTSIETDVLGDLTILAGNVWVNGNVADDLRIGGGDVKLNGSISDDLIVLSGNLNLSKESTVGGGVYFASGQVNLSGNVTGDVKGAAGSIYIDAVIEGNVELFGFDTVSFGPNAQVLGNFNYQDDQELANLRPDLVAGETIFKKSQLKTPENGRTFWRQVKWMMSFYNLLAMLFFGLFLIWIYRYYSHRISQTVHDHPLKSLGLGFAVAFLVPIAALLLTITIIGIPLSMVIIASWFILLYFGMLNAAIIAGSVLVKTNEKSGFLRLYGSFALGALIIFAFGLLPVVGFFIKFVLALVGLGGLVLYQHDLTLQLRKKKLI